jgi:hypothetical protein
MAPGESTVELPGGEAAPAASFEGEDDLQVEVDDDDAGNFDDDDGDDEAGYF